MDNVEIRPSTAADIKQFHEKLDHTVRAWSAFYKGELACIAGVEMTGTVILAFCHIKEDTDASKLTVWRGTMIIWEKMKALGYPQMYAYANPDRPNAGEYLKRLGFIKLDSSSLGERFLWQRV